MKYTVNSVLLISIALYCYGRPLPKWTPTTDEALIDESLKKSVHRINNDENVQFSQSDAKDVVCETYLEDGLHIKLSFILERQKWECALYKLNVETLGIQTDKCEQVENDNQQEDQLPSSDNDQEVDDEAGIDKLNQQNQNTNNNDDEEHDDEADLAKESNSNVQNVENEPENDDQVSEQNTVDEDQNTEVNNEGEETNPNNEGEDNNANNEDEDTNKNNE